jgi:sarcosine oxidase subunit gamma
VSDFRRDLAPDLALNSALGDAPRRLRFDGCELVELPNVAKLRIQAHRAELESLARRANALLPFAPNRALGEGPWLLWRAPGDWLAYALDGAAVGSAELGDLIDRRLAGLGLLAADLSSAYALFELSGPRALEVLLRDCTLDLEGDALPPGGCAQTPIAGLTVLLHRESAEARWRLFVDRTAARHFWRWLADSADLLLGPAATP